MCQVNGGKISFCFFRALFLDALHKIILAYDLFILQTIRHRPRRFRASAYHMLNQSASSDLHLHCGTVHSLNVELPANFDYACEAFAHSTKRSYLAR